MSKEPPIEAIEQIDKSDDDNNEPIRLGRNKSKAATDVEGARCAHSKEL